MSFNNSKQVKNLKHQAHYSAALFATGNQGVEVEAEDRSKYLKEEGRRLNAEGEGPDERESRQWSEMC